MLRAVAGDQAWWREWDGQPPRFGSVIVGRAVIGLGTAGVLTGLFLDGLSFALLLAVLAFNVGGGVIAWRIARRLEEEEGER